MDEIFSRNELYWGKEGQQKLADCHIAIFGLGGVGGFSAEMLARAGVGKLTLIDFDTVSKSNINRQIIALNSTVGKRKTELFEKRLKDINPDFELNVIDDFYTEDFQIPDCNFVIDAIDTMRSKVALLETCYNKKIPIITSMGAGNRIDPTQLYICDISEIRNKKDVFISNILRQLDKRNIKSGISCVVSDEKPICLDKIQNTEKIRTKKGEIFEFTKISPASTPFVASTAGIFMVAFVVKKILENK
jgi:tRNA threonylcarbamoyladenosine dehydratase